jgi:hypothetical protein
LSEKAEILSKAKSKSPLLLKMALKLGGHASHFIMIAISAKQKQ